ncbi:MAG: hypothetical protein WCF28_03960 [Methanobacterium sp.]|uniref:hypothetical protein n=1 Tax=Methanobacterium sp. TaxID=2164 RepID=UPI003C7828A1
MSIRLVFLIFVIVIFATGTGFLSYSQSTGKSLAQAYTDGNVVITQVTPAGSIPHHVNITNNGNEPINVQIGDKLISNSSQNLVIAQNDTINKNSTAIISAYCIQPSQRAVPGVKLTVNGTSSNAVIQVIDGSNPNDLNNATNTQLQIFILTSGMNFYIYSGEPVAEVQNQSITYTNYKQAVTAAAASLASTFNVSVNNISNINQNQTPNSTNSLNGFLNWVKTNTGI